MTYKTMMVNLRVGHANKDLLRITSTIARQFDASVIGIAACQIIPLVGSEGSSFVAAQFEAIERDLKAAEAEFRGSFGVDGRDVQWSAAALFETASDYVSRACHSADLIITTGLSFDPREAAQADNPASIVMQAGRPVLVVPPEVSTPKLDRIVVAWKNTREARRAIADALPFMKKATSVHVVQVAPEHERAQVSQQLSQVCAWLETHDIVAKAEFVPCGKGDDAYQLNCVVEKLNADLVVAGAYGHSRLREWALGGVTKDLTLQAEYCTMLSH